MNMLSPKREADQLSTGDWVVKVTPPSWSGFSPSLIRLTADQYARYLRWAEGRGGLIQELLPELSSGDREVLMSGIGSEELDDIGGDE